MSRRLQKVNNLLQQVIGELLLSEVHVPADVLVTVARVDTTPNLRSATVWLYVMPLEQAEVVLQELNQQLYHLQGAFNREVSMRPLPRLRLALDRGAAHAEDVERRLRDLKHDDE
jgi:ribosome-binding factor A